MTTKYNAAAAEARGETTVASLLGSMDGRDQYVLLQNLGLLAKARMLYRTDSRQHYRLNPLMAQVLELETTRPPDNHITTAATELAPVSETLLALGAYATRHGAKSLEPPAIVTRGKILRCAERCPITSGLDPVRREQIIADYASEDCRDTLASGQLGPLCGLPTGPDKSAMNRAAHEASRLTPAGAL